ncbi:hypothetical protein F383_17562 [Gossypium arboreum]|uniref:Uncharacterized protein n=1 Tax=Gossypium arboreum TaxID=29729 RepID=A0A0B0NNZ8_GOSAR|nr:hypothetical protein F383_17562 [Gossypium arboreum]
MLQSVYTLQHDILFTSIHTISRQQQKRQKNPIHVILSIHSIILKANNKTNLLTIS